MLRSHKFDHDSNPTAERGDDSFGSLFVNAPESSALYLILDRGKSASGRKVLISPVALQHEAASSGERRSLFFYSCD